MDISKESDSILKKKLEKLESKIPSCLPILKGSVTIVGGTNKLPKYSYRKNGKSYSIYLGVNKEPMAKKYVNNYHRLSEIIIKMSEINQEFLRRAKVPRAKRTPKNF